jgi:hypothetical protein
MGSVVWFVQRCIGIFLLGTLPLGTPSPHPREAIAKQTVAAVPLEPSSSCTNFSGKATYRPVGCSDRANGERFQMRIRVANRSGRTDGAAKPVKAEDIL